MSQHTDNENASSYLASAFHLWKKSAEERVVASKYLEMGTGNLRTKLWGVPPKLCEEDNSLTK